MARSTHPVVLLAILAAAGAASLPQAQASDRIHFPIATGSVNGTYYPIGEMIAKAISHPPGARTCADSGNCGVPNLVATAQSSEGSVANVRAIQNGLVPSGFAQADIALDAVRGTGPFANMPPLDKIRALANLYLEFLHVVVRRDAGINRIDDLRGRRVSIDTAGSGTRRVAGIVLTAHGLDERDILVTHAAPERASTQLRQAGLDAFFIVAGTPTLAVETLTSDGIAAVLPLEPERIRSIVARHHFFSAAQIDAGVYRNVDATATIAVGAQWLVSADMDEGLVYDICRAFWSTGTRAALDNGHPQGRHITLETALTGIAIPLHSGAARCYRDLARDAPAAADRN